MKKELTNSQLIAARDGIIDEKLGAFASADVDDLGDLLAGDTKTWWMPEALTPAQLTSLARIFGRTHDAAKAEGDRITARSMQNALDKVDAMLRANHGLERPVCRWEALAVEDLREAPDWDTAWTPGDPLPEAAQSLTSLVASITDSTTAEPADEDGGDFYLAAMGAAGPTLNL